MYEKVSLQGDAAIEKIILLIVERMRPTSGLEPGTQEVSGVCQGRGGDGLRAGTFTLVSKGRNGTSKD